MNKLMPKRQPFFFYENLQSWKRTKKNIW